MADIPEEACSFFLLLKGNGGGTDLGEREVGGDGLGGVERGNCSGDIIYERRIKGEKENRLIYRPNF